MIKQHFMMQVDNDLTKTAKETQEFLNAKKWDNLECQDSHLISKLKAERPTNKQ